MTKPTTVEEAIKMCTPIVNKIAHKWKRNHYNEFHDLQQCGFMGVCEAYKRYEEGHGTKFTSYAWWWIRAQIREYALTKWDYNNHTASDEFVQDPGYELNTDIIDLERNLERLSKEDRKIFSMRMEGKTFDEIAKVTSHKSLHSVRNRMIEINTEMEQC